MKSLEISIDKKATKRNVIEALKKYNRLLRLQMVRTMPKVTQSFQFIPPSTAKSLNTIENSVYKNIEREKLLKDRDEYISTIHEAVEKLDGDNRYIIVNRYISDDETDDYTIYSDLGVGRTKYYKLKQEAFIQLAFFLGIEVYKTTKEEC
ncbi:ArpU family transcriptional regulator [Macrococcus hajekii]|uniref:ArpU family transcriptional regulator n=1 Tax=Macrococcus hajekii TaxID=198482 RepID=A0A4R6BNH7_9STAP|nr:ArpU family phage packaging/lysis transcriptional regulator [Macrococcus hajekii]TDM03413.1 ArpU family transcriptional regulator [Macrococcus hajekii]GGA98677.1 hypothetical protein GCM10007190_03330 [Macrococcus hajekii]